MLPCSPHSLPPSNSRAQVDKAADSRPPPRSLQLLFLQQLRPKRFLAKYFVKQKRTQFFPCQHTKYKTPAHPQSTIEKPPRQMETSRHTTPFPVPYELPSNRTSANEAKNRARTAKIPSKKKQYQTKVRARAGSSVKQEHAK